MKHVSVIGCGTMGNGIAHVSALSGFSTILMDIKDELVQQGFNAVNLIKEGTKSINGGGGGKPELAQAGGKNPEMLPEAINSIRKLIKTLQK